VRCDVRQADVDEERPGRPFDVAQQLELFRSRCADRRRHDRQCDSQGQPAMPTIGELSGNLAAEPRNGAPPNENTPPSDPAIHWAHPALAAVMPTAGAFIGGGLPGNGAHVAAPASKAVSLPSRVVSTTPRSLIKSLVMAT